MIWKFMQLILPARDWVYIAAIIVLVIIGVISWRVHDHNIAAQAVAHENAVLQVQSNRLKAAAQVEADRADRDYQAKLANMEFNYAKSLQDAAAANIGDLQRLRDANAALRARTMPETTACPITYDDTGPTSFARMGAITAKLADALRTDDASLTKCWDERASIGK